MGALDAQQQRPTCFFSHCIIATVWSGREVSILPKHKYRCLEYMNNAYPVTTCILGKCHF